VQFLIREVSILGSGARGTFRDENRDLDLNRVRD